MNRQPDALGDSGTGPEGGSRLLDACRRPVLDLVRAGAATVACALPVFLVGALAVQVRAALDFGVPTLGLVVTLFYLSSATFSVPLASLVDRLGAPWLMRRMPLVTAVLMLALAATARSWVYLAIFAVPCGMASTAVGAATNQYLAWRVRPEHQGIAFGIKQAAVPTAALLGGSAVPSVAITIGWRWAFVFGAAAAACAGLLTPSSASGPIRRPAARREQLAYRGRLPLVVLGVGTGLSLFSASGLAALLVTEAVSRGFAAGTAGLVAALASGAAVAMRVGCGLLADRLWGDHLAVVAVLMAAAVGGYVVLLAGIWTGTAGLFVAGAVLALGAGWGWNGLFNLALVRSYIGAPALATGATQVGSRLGAMLGPVGLGLLVQHASYPAAWAVAAAAELAAVGAIVCARRVLTHRRPGAGSFRIAGPHSTRLGAGRVGIDRDDHGH